MPTTAPQDWLPGFERIDVGPDGGTWADATSPWRGCLHSTEGGWDAALSAYRAKGIPPHFTVDPVARRKAQHVALNRSSYALENDPGGVETNRSRCVQVEIVGHAATMDELTDDQLRWLAEQVMRPIMAAVPIKAHAPTFYGEDAGFTLATETAPQRLSFDAWRSFDGWCGHQHVPENAHWDPGHLDVPRIFYWLTPTPTATEDDMIAGFDKTPEDEARATIRALCHQFWGNGKMTTADQDYLLGEWRKSGRERMMTLLTDHPKAV